MTGDSDDEEDDVMRMTLMILMMRGRSLRSPKMNYEYH